MLNLLRSRRSSSFLRPPIKDYLKDRRLVIWACYRIIHSQDDDTLDELLKPYRMTGANLTTFRMVLNRFPFGAAAAAVTGDDEMMRSLASRRTNGDYATVHDTLLSLYHGVLIQSLDGSAGSCHWAGKERLLSTLVKVGRSLRLYPSWRASSTCCCCDSSKNIYRKWAD
jgi:hypothetical protein